MLKDRFIATPKFPKMLHGGDYNPEQWKDYPDILEKDLELMKKANINCVTLGVFSWANLEPEEDHFELDWLEDMINKLYQNGIYTVLATPSGARPHWLAEKYPEVLRVAADGTRNQFGGRHNHCYTSRIYRKRVREIDTRLAERFADHPGVILWHISNEFGGECHCELCQEAFRSWLKEKYHTLDQLNHAWWTNFWSHTYTDWSQIHSPSPKGEDSIHGLNLDWRRFVTHQTVDFMKKEISAIRAVNPEVPVTTNMMNIFTHELNYYAFKDELDVIAWDSYPDWHAPNSNLSIAMMNGICHDMMRSIKGQPFLLMECTPNQTNWQKISKIKKPGMHHLSVMQAVAHGADSGQYFQIRQSRGSCEKFHSAVISHTGTENTRTFHEVSATGESLGLLSKLCYGSIGNAEIAIIHDVESLWALEDCRGPRNQGLDYFGELFRQYNYFWKKGYSVDVVDSTYDFSGYKLVIAPMLYMYHNGIQDKLRKFVEDGGILVTTAFSGVVNETDLCFLGEDTEEKLSDVLGMWVRETDALYDEEHNSTKFFGKDFTLSKLCEIIQPTTAKVLAKYDSDFYAGSPVVTVNQYGEGSAYHIASCADYDFYDDFYEYLLRSVKLSEALPINLPENIIPTVRETPKGKLIFLQNYSTEVATFSIGSDYEDILNQKELSGRVKIGPYSCRVLLDTNKHRFFGRK